MDFAIIQVSRAIKNISAGDITPKPLKYGQNKTCKFCEYKGLCCYFDDNDNVQETIATIEELKQNEGKK